MATKTISVDLEAYERLKRARLRPDESFSRVIKRAHWEAPACTGEAILKILDGAEPAPESVIARLERAQLNDAAPPDPWSR